MRLLPRRRSALERLAAGSGTYEVTFARSVWDIETVIVNADSRDEAIAKAERWLFANIFPRTVARDGVHLWPPGGGRVGKTVTEAAAEHSGRLPGAPVTDLTRREGHRSNLRWSDSTDPQPSIPPSEVRARLRNEGRQQ